MGSYARLSTDMAPNRTEYSDLPEATPQDPGKTLPEAVVAEPSPYEGLQAREHQEPYGAPYYAPDAPYADKTRWTNGEPLPGYPGGGRGTADSRDWTTRRICGLPQWMFSLLVIIATLVVIGAAVGGGVGGALAGKKDDDATATTTTSTTSSAPTSSSTDVSQNTTTSAVPSTTTSTVSISSTTIVGPSASSLVRDCPSVNNTIYSYGSSSSPMLFRRLCGMSLKNIGGADLVNQPVRTLENCIDLCGSYNTQNASGISAGTSQPCNAVCWRNTFNTDFPGQCFGFTTQNSSDAFTITQPIETQCDSAGWINQSF